MVGALLLFSEIQIEGIIMNKNLKMLCIYICSMTVLPIIVSLIFNGIHNIGYSLGELWILDEQGTLYTNFTIYIFLIVIFLKEYRNEIRKDWKEVKEHILSIVLL